MNRVKWALHDKKNPLLWPKNFEIQNLLLIHLPIYKSIFFQGHPSKKFFFVLRAAQGEKIFFWSDDPEKKKFAYTLVNGLIANFEFQSFWVKKVEFFFHGSPILPRSVLKFFWRVSNLLYAKT